MNVIFPCIEPGSLKFWRLDLLFNSPNVALIQHDGSRRNNFTTIRIVFSWLVLYGHSYAIQKTPGINDPLNILFQGSLWIGEAAVNGFFAISGYLVASSYVKRGLIDYAISRLLRILPALIVCIFVSVFIFGPLFTTLSLSDYFTDSKTYQYLTNAFAYFKMKWTLPGVFEMNFLKAINGSLWTLTVEVRCYLILAIIGFLKIFKVRIITNIFLLSFFLFGVYFFSYMPLLGINIKWSRPSLYFLIGVLFYINRDRILLDFWLAFTSLIAVLLSFGKEWFIYVFPIAFVYLIFYSAYSTKYIDTDGMIGDISYGIYIYAFPVQQGVAYLFPHFTPLKNTIFSSIIVITIAVLSWHYIEKPILSLKKLIFGFRIRKEKSTLLGRS